MKIKKFSKYLNILFFLCIFFISKKNVIADTHYERYELEQDYNKTEILDRLSGTNLEIYRIENNLDEARIAVCVYSCSYNNSLDYKIANANGKNGYGVTCGPEGSKWNWITYQIDEKANASEKGYKWRVNAGMTQQTKEDDVSNIFETMYQGEKIYYPGPSAQYLYDWKPGNNGSKNLPAIYFEKSAIGNVNEYGQTNEQIYVDLKDSFICPQYVYFDKSNIYVTVRNDMELCYSNGNSNCETRNEEKTIFKDPDVLVYSFTEELDKVLDELYTDIETDSYMNILKPYTNEALSGQPFTDNICSLMLENNLESKINDSNLSLDLNKRFSNAIKLVNRNSYNIEFYNYEDLARLMITDKSDDTKNLKYNNNSINGKYDKVIKYHTEKIIEAVEHYKEKCEINIGTEIQINTENLREQINNNLDSLVTYQEVNLEPLNCDNLFAEFADVIKTAYFLIEIGSLILVIVLSVLEYAKIILADGQDEMKKTNQKLVKRLIVLVVIFLLPAVVNLILTMFEIEGFNSDNPLCIKDINK